MEKQTKVVNKIKGTLNSGQANTALGVKNNDECYTDMQDILNELSQWAALGKFQGKKIVCPCDWDVVKDESIYSITITYKDPGVEVVGNNVYKAVKSVKYIRLFDLNGETTEEQIELAEDEIEDFLRDKLTCNFVRTFTQNARAWGIKSITASGYNPAIDKGVKFQDIDYSKYDVCVTNPPFSLKAEFMASIVGKIDFIVLLPFVSRNKNPIGIPMMLKQAYLGFGVHLPLTFANPTKENNYSGEKSVACDWITSFPEAQAERNARHFKSGVKYDLYKDDFEIVDKMVMKDDTLPIRVSTSTYPEDYDGWMFAAISVLDNLDQETYEWYATDTTGFFNNDPIGKTLSPYKGRWTCENIAIGSKKLFGGIVFRKKSVGEDTNA
jgi:hypothetical protein